MLPALIPILVDLIRQGGPEAMHLIEYARAHGAAADVAELDRQIAVDEIAQAALQREIDRITALRTAAPAKEQA